MVIKRKGKASGFTLLLLLNAACLIPAPTGTETTVKKYIQFGFESYLGSNHLHSYTPWLGIRFAFSPSLSYIFKYQHHFLSFQYENDENLPVTRKADLNNMTHVFYYQKKKTDVYSAISLLLGTDRYTALSLESGVEQRLWRFLAVNAGVYLLDESSILWYPEEKKRMIYLTAARAGLKIFFTPRLSLNPQITLYRNDEDVTARDLAVGLSFTPRDPFFITAYFHHYSESSIYRFRGNYLSLGIQYYR